MKYSWIPLATTLLLSSAAFANDTKPTLSQQLEQAIYAEQTLGELDKAAALYEAIVQQELSNKSITAEALARLIECQKKQGKLEDARANFQKIKAEYAEQSQWVKAAEATLGLSTFAEQDLLPVPWVDGEALAYNKLTFNKSLNSYAFQVKKQQSKYSSTVDSAWSTELSLFTVSNQHQEYWQYIADEKTNHLLFSFVKTLHHKGKQFIAQDGSLKIKDLDQGTEYSFPKGKNDYDQGIVNDIMRRLPLAQNYQTTLPLFQNIQASIKVVAINEKVEVPAGQFSTYHLKIDYLANGAPAAFAEAWISNDENRYLVKYIQGEMRDELAAVLTKKIELPRTHNDAKGFSITLPATWFSVYNNFTAPKDGGTHLQPLKTFETGADIQVLNRPNVDWENGNMDMVVEHINSWDYSWLKSYKHRDDSVEHFEQDGLQGVRLKADVVFNQAPMTLYRVVIAHHPDFVLFNFMTPTEGFEDRKTTYDSIVNSLTF